VGALLVRRLAAGALLLAAALGCARGAAAGAVFVDLRVLTYNTRGLPAWVARDDPAGRARRIAPLVGAYDVALLQEDFAHHPILRAGLGGLVVERGNPSLHESSALCLLGCQGSGLTFLTRLPRERLLELVNRAYRTCAGWLGGANDCLATKGFQHARLLLPGDLEIHVVNTHLDAGRGPEDREVRRAQLERLRGYLEGAAPGAALVVGGDLNLDARDPADVALRDAFVGALSLVDTGAAPDDPSRERLDYLYRRDGVGVLLQVLAAGEAREFSPTGLALSDHPALFAHLRARPLF
jgi:endonuclease/exonuclease/phosphatase family metal-dependent hydrolase